MKANFRQLYVFNLDVGSKKKNAVLPSMADLLAVIEQRRAAGQAQLAIENGDVQLALGPIVIDSTQQTASVLIRHSDKYAAESVYSDIATDTFTPHPKADTEGGETGVHVFISLAPERATPNRYTCLIEKVPSLDAAKVRRFLNRILHDEYTANANFFSYPHPGGQMTRAGTVATERCLPRFDVEGRPSQRLADDVQQGRLTGIVLKRTITQTQVGGVPFLKKREATLKLEVDQGHLTANIWADVKRALAAEAADYPTAQVGIRLPGRAKTVSVKVDSVNGAPLTELYVQSFDIWNISPPMAHSARAVVPQFASRALPLLLRERSI